VNDSDDDPRQLLAGRSAYRHGGPGAEAIIAITSSMIFIYHMNRRLDVYLTFLCHTTRKTYILVAKSHGLQ
jgi:hypothetical protein